MISDEDKKIVHRIFDAVSKGTGDTDYAILTEEAQVSLTMKGALYALGYLPNHDLYFYLQELFELYKETKKQERQKEKVENMFLKLITYQT